MTTASNRDSGGLNGDGLSATEATPLFFPRRGSSSSANPLLSLRSSLIRSLKLSNSSLRQRQGTTTLEDASFSFSLSHLAPPLYHEHKEAAWHAVKRYDYVELLGVLPPPDCIDKFIVKCAWMQETFSDLPEGVDEETVRRYAKAYIKMLLST
ncbi:hypothetical protein Ahy_B09g094934 [Arachis hypogaea]|uniref:Uncharacterized protein n=1 Tax=Arachis hypogaea TaxID=3818 RepID=A0A444XCI3_ARAHY|nr:hypothetical protein Ahy_B09g094934 [Arachis hypogaea]